jgi:hypothetical protein
VLQLWPRRKIPSGCTDWWQPQWLKVVSLHLGKDLTGLLLCSTNIKWYYYGILSLGCASKNTYPNNTLANLTLIILFLEMLKIFKNYSFQIKKYCEVNSKYLGIFHLLKWIFENELFIFWGISLNFYWQKYSKFNISHTWGLKFSKSPSLNLNRGRLSDNVKSMPKFSYNF